MPVPTTLTMAKFQRLASRRNLLVLLVVVYQVLALAVFVAAPFFSISFTQRPFIGSFIDQTLILDEFRPLQPGSWELRNLFQGFGHQVVEVNGQAVTTSRQMYRELGGYGPGEPVTLTIRSPGGELSQVTVHLQGFPLIDQTAYLYVPYFIGLIYLLSSFWVFMLRYKDPAGRAFAIFTASVAIVLAALFDTFTTHNFTYLWTLALALSGGSLFNLATIFPEELRLVERYPFLRWIGYVPAVLLVLRFPTLYDYSQPFAYVTTWRYAYILAGLGILCFLGLTTLRQFSSVSPIARAQSKLILLGALISFAPIGIWFLITVSDPDILFHPGIMISTAAFPLMTGYTILRYRLLKTDYLVSRAVLYGLLALVVAVVYALVVTGFGLILGSTLSINSPLVAGILFFVLALLIHPLRIYLQRWVDKAFSRGQEVYRERLQAFSRELTQAMELSTIIALLRKDIEESLKPGQTHIFVYDPLGDHYTAFPDSSGKPTTDLRFASTSPLMQMLASRRNSIFLGEAYTVPSALQHEKARLLLLGAQAFIPLPGRNQLTGWLGLGGRASGEPYVDRDLTYLESLCDQAALAVERAQVLANLERRMHEMNVLTRVSQGINITIAFDDMLELIYAQTNQVIPTVDFRITLLDSFSNYLYHVFFLENDERLNERENVPLMVGQGLEQEVIDTHRPLVSDDYERECHNRGVLPAAQGIYAWLGVPLNAGAETIGLVSLGSRDTSTAYSDQQINLLQAIADQAAGAIVKARLLQESERRTRQLTSLNEVARSLTSTLELDRLLNQILNSAVEILNCEAGSLLLVDEQTDELIFEVVTGPVAADLMGKRLPSGTGLVGKAVDTRQPIIANDVRRTKEWFENPDQQTGFKTQDLLVVPMQVKDRIIGVIEVINRKDGLPFTVDDQELLAAFTSQAAVAIENARLYTLTDQALAARVEELSVMQRIDRELNASLDVARAMRITLGWAMRQSSADAGLVGVVEDSGVRVMASAGYTNELEPYKESPLPASIPALQRSIETGQVQVFQANGSRATTGLLLNARSQLAIPIRREDETIGLMLLENIEPEEYSAETVDFLSRLSDHAAIAIANAQLYTEVQTANMAKSKFVSFVAHELKNPMASIKGYTELVAGGMAGPVNDMQSSFLATVSANLDRMNTIVSDLNDLTKIEVGALRLDFKAVRLQEVIEEVVRSMRKQLDEKQQEVILQIPESVPLVWADPSRLGQILTNTLSNAFKYTPPEGKIWIGLETCAEGDEQPGPNAVHLWVKDSGIGISDEDKEKIFQQYFRTERSRDFAPGTGLGLHITKQLVEMQGGRIWFDSEVNLGTTFHFTVPVSEAV